MNKQHTKSFRAAYDYWFEDKPLNEVISALQSKEEVLSEERIEKIAKREQAEIKVIKVVNEGFDTHVLCSSCGSGDLELSKKRTKIRCKECGNTALTESISGLKSSEAKKKTKRLKKKKSKTTIEK